MKKKQIMVFNEPNHHRQGRKGKVRRIKKAPPILLPLLPLLPLPPPLMMMIKMMMKMMKMKIGRKEASKPTRYVCVCSAYANAYVRIRTRVCI